MTFVLVTGKCFSQNVSLRQNFCYNFKPRFDLNFEVLRRWVTQNLKYILTVLYIFFVFYLRVLTSRRKQGTL